MRRLLFSMTALAVLIPLPAAALPGPDNGSAFRSGSGGNDGFGRRDGGRRHDGRGRGGVNDGVFIYDYYREYQGDTAWKSDSFNDWWHDRPDRAYPRWMLNNQNCQRLWWSGGNWRC